MALTYTLAGLQTVLSEVETSVLALDWVTARKHLVRAHLVRAGLPASLSADGASVTLFAQLDAIERLLAASEDSERSTGERSRFISTTVGHKSGGRRSGGGSYE